MSYSKDGGNNWDYLEFDKRDFEDRVIPTRIIAVLQGAGGGGGGLIGGGGGAGACWIGVLNLKDPLPWEFSLGAPGKGGKGSSKGGDGEISWIRCFNGGMAKVSAAAGNGGGYVSGGDGAAAATPWTRTIDGEPMLWQVKSFSGESGGAGGLSAKSSSG